MTSATPLLSALEKAKQEKANKDAELKELGKKIEKVEARIEALLENPESDQDGRKLLFQKEMLARLDKYKDALLEKDKAFNTSIARLRELEAQQGAGTACNVFSLRVSFLLVFDHHGARAAWHRSLQTSSLFVRRTPVCASGRLSREQVRHAMSRVSVQFWCACFLSCILLSRFRASYPGSFLRTLFVCCSYALFLVCENCDLVFELTMQIICAHDFRQPDCGPTRSSGCDRG